MLTGKTLLITGGSGFFGQAFAHHALQAGAKAVRIFSRGEALQAAMQARMPSSRLRFLIGDVREIDRLRLAMRGVDYVIHAAALKRIESCAYNPDEAVATNVTGTQRVVRAALDADIERLLLISTDKACLPITHYGQTKAVAESTVLGANVYLGGPPRFSVVRYGNVANSTGSVIPLWRQQAARGDALTVTDVRCTRFWISLEEAVRFVDWALDQPGGKCYVPPMPSYKVLDLAFAVQQSTRPVTVIGMRGIEKLHEDCIAAHETDVIGPAQPMNSGTNTHWLDVTDLQDRLAAIEGT